MAIVIQTLSDSAQARKDLGDLKQSVLGIQKSTEGLSNKFASIGKSIAFGAAAVGTAAGLIKAVDAATNLSNRINSVTESAQEAKQALWAINNISTQTRTSLDATAKLYTKLTMASKDLGASQEQIAIVTRTVNQGFRISGASTEESKAAITQLSQAFASGKLAGDEFNSVMENAPFLAREITKGMGISLGELYELRDAGKLYAKDVFGAILRQSDQVDAKARKLKITYGEAFGNLGNSFKQLFNAAVGAFSSETVGPADIINGWAESISNFAQNFTYYLLKAKTAAIVFIIDVTSFFTKAWEAIQKGPEGLVEVFGMIVAVATPYVQKLADLFKKYADVVYRGTSEMFFKFLDWLRRSDTTAGIADVLERTNQAILNSFLRLQEVINRIDFKAIFERLTNSYRSAVEALKSFDIAGFLARMWEGINNTFTSLKVIDINKFIPNLDTALTTVKRWAEQAAHWFWWLYDVVIGHSYIPDLVSGVIAWMSKLTGAPVGFVKAFVGIAGGLFASLNPFKVLNKGLMAFISLLKIATKLLAVGALGVGGAAAFSVLSNPAGPEVGAARLAAGAEDAGFNTAEALGGMTPQDKLDYQLKSGSRDAALDLKTLLNTSGGSGGFAGMLAGTSAMGDNRGSGFKRIGDAVKKPLEGTLSKLNEFFNGNFKVLEQDQFTGKVTENGYRRGLLMDKLHIPGDMQAKLALGISAAVVAGMYLGMKSGKTRDVTVSLMTTALLVGFARISDKKHFSTLGLNMASGFMGWVEKGFKLLLGHKISDDPFGFAILIAKLSLVFKAGRDYMLALAKNVALAPGMAGAQVANRVAYGGQLIQAKVAENSVKKMTKGLDLNVKTSQARFDDAMSRLIGSTNNAGQKMGEAAAKLAVMNKTLPNGFGNAPLNDVLNRQRELEAAQSARAAPKVSRAEAAAVKLREAATATGKKFQEQAVKLREGLGNFGATVGGTIGTGVGLELGNRWSAKYTADRQMEYADKLQKSAVTRDGERLTKEDAMGVIKGEIKIGELDQAGQKLAAVFVKEAEAPAMQRIFRQLGGMAAGQAIGAMLGSITAQLLPLLLLKLPMVIATATLRALGITAAAQIAFEGTKARAKAIFEKTYFYAWYAIALVWEKTQRVASYVAGAIAARAPMLATGLAMGAQSAIGFLAGIASMPVLIGAAVVAAVVAAGYLIYKYRDEIKASFVKIKDLIKEAFTEPQKFFDALPDRFGKIIDKIRGVLPEWLGGTAPEPAPKIKDNGVPMAGYATGGHVRGPGTGTSDSILAWLSNGEFVINAESAARHRGLLEAINGGGDVPAFADGGLNKAKPRPPVSVGTVGTKEQYNDISGKLTEARAEQARLSKAIGEATIGWQRDAAQRIYDQWTQFIEDFTSIGEFISRDTNDVLSGKNPVDKEKEKKPKDYSLKFGEALSAINEFFPELDLTADEFMKMTDSVREGILGVVAKFGNVKKFADDLQANDPAAVDAYQKIEIGKNKYRAPFTDSVRAVQTPFKQLEKRAEKFKLDLSEETFQQLDKKTVGEVNAYLTRMEEWAAQLKTKMPGEGKDIRQSMNLATERLEELLKDATFVGKNFYETVNHAANKVGVDVDRGAFARLKNKVREDVAAVINRIVELQKIIDDPNTSEASRRSSQAEIDLGREGIEKVLKKPENEIKQRGEEFVESMRQSFSEGMRSVLTGKGFDVIGIATLFRDKLLEGFSDMFTKGLFNEGGMLNGAFDLLGRQSATAGQTAAGAVNKDNGGIFKKVGGVFGNLFGKKKESLGTQTAEKIVDAAPTVGADIGKELIGKAGEIGTDIGKSTSDTLSKATQGGGGGLMGLAGAGGSLLGMLIGSFFAEGGDVRGPGTGTSDSIPAMLSNGEFVVKARQAGKYRGMLHAINNDQLPAYADGGLVGADYTTPAMINTIDKTRDVSVDASTKADTYNFNVNGDTTRQTRKDILGMIPQIAAGINAYNKEKGIR